MTAHLATLSRLLEERDRKNRMKPGRIPSAVLVPLFWTDGVPHLLFTRRPDDMPHHPGQVSFPGGMEDPGDANPEETALRETEEELGIAPARIELLGRLDDVWTITGPFVITPVVGRLDAPRPRSVDEREVACVFTVPLPELQDPSRLRIETFEYEGRGHPVPYYDWGDHTIWGATGRIVQNFLDIWEQLTGETS